MLWAVALWIGGSPKDKFVERGPLVRRFVTALNYLVPPGALEARLAFLDETRDMLGPSVKMACYLGAAESDQLLAGLDHSGDKEIWSSLSSGIEREAH